MLVWRTLTLRASIAACIVSLSSVFFQVLLPGKDLVSPSIEGEKYNCSSRGAAGTRWLSCRAPLVRMREQRVLPGLSFSTNQMLLAQAYLK